MDKDMNSWLETTEFLGIYRGIIGKTKACVITSALPSLNGSMGIVCMICTWIQSSTLNPKPRPVGLGASPQLRFSGAQALS